MVAYRIATSLLLGALSTSSAASTAAYRSLASNTVTVSSDSSETSASVTVRCDNEVDSTINLYVVPEDDIAGVISFGDSVSELTKGANEGCRRLNDATDPGDYDEDCRRLKDLTDPGLFDDGTPIYPNSTAFYMEKVNVPATESLQSSNQGSESVFIAGQRFETGFVSLLRTGDEIGGEVFGRSVDQNMATIMAYPQDDDGFELAFTEPTSQIKVSQNPDFTSMLKNTAEGRESDYVMFTHFENPRPSVIYRLNVDLANDCSVVVKSIEPVDASEWGGIWIPCAGSVTSWNTHLGSEEYEPDAKNLAANVTYEEFAVMGTDLAFSAADIVNYLRFFGIYYPTYVDNMDLIRSTFNPYKYGHVTEFGLDESGATTVSKWYTMGRQGMEMAEVMPDDKTVLISDDGTNCLFTAFVMDTPKDLSSGTLYIAKFNQTDDNYGGSFDISWIELGKATQDELVELVEGLTFDDIFEYTDPTIEGQSCSCPEGYTGINAGHSGAKAECLKLKDGMEKAAAFFETRRFGSMMGGTTELSKFEGVAFVANSKTGKNEVYAAISDVRSGMEDFMGKGKEDDSFDVCGHNDIRLPYNGCGCVYQMDLEEVDGWMQITKARGYLCGDKNAGTSDFDSCDVNNIASPDNLGWLGKKNGANAIFIAEDTSGHQNDYAWMVDLNTGERTRFLTSVYGAEVTGVGLYEFEGCSVMTSVIQHPYGESDQDMMNSTYSQGGDGYLGYIGPIGCKDGTTCSNEPELYSNNIGDTIVDVKYTADATSADDYSHTFTMDGLMSGTAYKYQAYCVSEEFRTGADGVFVTAPGEGHPDDDTEHNGGSVAEASASFGMMKGLHMISAAVMTVWLLIAVTIF